MSQHFFGTSKGKTYAITTFKEDVMLKSAKELLSQGVNEASWLTSRGEKTELTLYIVPSDEIDEEYLSGFEKLFNFVRDESERYGIFLGNR